MVRLDQPVSFDLNGRGNCILSKGRNSYTGSARGPGGLRSSIRRHFSQQKKIHWHIDRLTVKADELGAYVSMDATECELAEMLSASGSFVRILNGFGSSDCSTCTSHLLKDVHW